MSILKDYVNSNWERDIDTRRSITNYLFLIENTVIFWKSRLQKTVTLSFYEVEYMILKNVIKKQLWLRSMFKDLIILIEIDFKELYTDSESVRFLVKNPVYHERTKHIDI